MSAWDKILNPYQLEKLTIGIKSKAKAPEAASEFVAQYNPESLSVSHQRTTDNTKLVNGRVCPQSRARELSRLKLTLILDGTEVDQPGLQGHPVSRLWGGSMPTVEQRVARLLQVCVGKDDSDGLYPVLLLRWSSAIAWTGSAERKSFSCRLLSVDVAYKSFNRSGEPLNAELAVEFLEEQEQEEPGNTAELASTKLAGDYDSVALLALVATGSAISMVQIARDNDLDQLRPVEPEAEVRIRQGGGGTT